MRPRFLLLLSALAVALNSPNNKRSVSLIDKLKYYEVVHIHHERHDPSPNAIHAAPLKHINFTAFNEHFHAELRQNHQLFAPNYYEAEDHYENGRLMHQVKIPRENIEMCHYVGHIKGRSIAVSSCESHMGIFAMFLHSEGLIGIEPAHRHLDHSTLQKHLSRMKGTLSRSTTLPTLHSLHLIFKSSDFHTDDDASLRCTVGDHMAVPINPTNKHSHTSAHGPLSNHQHQHHHHHDHHDHHDHQKHQEHHDHQDKHDHHHHNDHFAESQKKKLQFFEHVTGGSTFSHRRLASDTKWVELLVANDVEWVKVVEAKPNSKVTTETSTIANFVLEFYKAGGIFDPPIEVVLVAQHTFKNQDPWSTIMSDGQDGQREVSVTALLRDWHRWRSNVTNGIPHHDNGQLFSGLNFAGQTVGFANVGSMCMKSASGGINQMGSTLTNKPAVYKAAVVAHEMGHNFGMSHDSSNDNGCPASGFIMNAIITSQTPTNFSTCSVSYYDKFKRNTLSCLGNKPSGIWSEMVPVCGNGWLETGEECDCGSKASCTDECCDATTCKLVSGSTCSNNDPCCEKCSIIPKSSNKVCRASKNDCDIEEKCDGLKGTCGDDWVHGAGYLCKEDSDTGKCLDGLCITLTQQCKEFGDVYTKCEDQDNCGDLKCSSTASSACNTFTDRRDSGDDSSKTTQVRDGTLCSGGQCKDGRCYKSDFLNPNYFWVKSTWSKCYECEEKQTRQAACKQYEPNGDTVEVLLAACVATSQPVTERLCSVTTAKDGKAAKTCAHGSNDNDLDRFARDLQDQYNLLERAKDLHKAIPRFYGPSTFEPENMDYWIGIGILGSPGVLFWLVSFIWCILFYCGNCGCGSKTIDPAGYTWKQRYGPWFMLMVLILLGMVACAIGLFYNGEFRRGLEDSDNGLGVTVAIDSLVDDSAFVIVTLQKKIEFINTADAILDSINSKLPETIVPIKSGFDAINTSITQFNIIVDDYKNVVITGVSGAPDLLVTCPFCVGVATQANASQALLERSTKEALAQIDQAVTDGQVILTDAKDQFGDSKAGLISEVNTQLTEGLKLINSEIKPGITEYKTLINEVDGYRWPITFALYSIPYGMAIFTLIAGLLGGKPFLFRLSVMGAWIVLVTMWLLMAFYLPFATVVGDSCEFMTQMESEQDLSSIPNLDPTVAKVLSSCLLNMSIIESLNASDAFAVASQTIFPEIPELNPDVSLINNLTGTAAALSDKDFYVSTVPPTPGTLPQDGLTMSNEITTQLSLFFGLDPNGQAWTRDSFSQQYTSTDPSLSAAANEVKTKILAETWINAAIKAIHGNVSYVQNVTNTTNSNILKATNEIANFPAEIGPITDAVKSLQEFRCAQVGESYREFKSAWCSIINVATLFSALVQFIVGMLAFIWVFMTVSIEKKMKYPEGKVQPKGYNRHQDNLQMSGRSQHRDRRAEKDNKQAGRRQAVAKHKQRKMSDYDG